MSTTTGIEPMKPHTNLTKGGKVIESDWNRMSIRDLGGPMLRLPFFELWPGMIVTEGCQGRRLALEDGATSGACYHLARYLWAEHGPGRMWLSWDDEPPGWAWEMESGPGMWPFPDELRWPSEEHAIYAAIEAIGTTGARDPRQAPPALGWA